MTIEKPKIGVQQCPCGYARCRTFWLTGIGSFYQGSGFSEKEATRIAELINNDPDFPED